MIDKVIEFALRQRVFVILGAVGLLVAGLWYWLDIFNAAGCKL